MPSLTPRSIELSWIECILSVSLWRRRSLLRDANDRHDVHIGKRIPFSVLADFLPLTTVPIPGVAAVLTAPRGPSGIDIGASSSAITASAATATVAASENSGRIRDVMDVTIVAEDGSPPPTGAFVTEVSMTGAFNRGDQLLVQLLEATLDGFLFAHNVLVDFILRDVRWDSG